LVPPPAFAAKKKRLLEILSGLDSKTRVDVRVTAAQVQKEIDSISGESDPKQELHDEHLLAKFVLLRWDQLEELAHILLRVARSNKMGSRLVLDVQTLKSALKEIADTRLKEYAPYLSFLRDRARSGRDFGKDVVWLVDGPKPTSRKALSLLRNANGVTWCLGTRDIIVSAAETDVEFTPLGTVKFRRSNSQRSTGRPPAERRASRTPRSKRRRI
jgi:hypothetical protein